MIGGFLQAKAQRQAAERNEKMAQTQERISNSSTRLQSAFSKLPSGFYENHRHLSGHFGVLGGKFIPHSKQCEGCGAWRAGGSVECDYCGRPM